MRLGRLGAVVLGVFVESPPASTRAEVSVRCACVRGSGSPAQACLPAEEETHPVDLSSLSSKLLPGFTTLGFKDERRGKGECATGCGGEPPKVCRPTCCWSCIQVLTFKSRNKTKVL